MISSRRWLAFRNKGFVAPCNFSVISPEKDVFFPKKEWHALKSAEDLLSVESGPPSWRKLLMRGLDSGSRVWLYITSTAYTRQRPKGKGTDEGLGVKYTVWISYWVTNYHKYSGLNSTYILSLDSVGQFSWILNSESPKVAIKVSAQVHSVLEAWMRKNRHSCSLSLLEKGIFLQLQNSGSLLLHGQQESISDLGGGGGFHPPLTWLSQAQPGKAPF